MKWSYTVVQYAILNEEWIKEHGDHWAAGRIECWTNNEDVERMRTEKLKQLMGCRERLWT